MARDKGTNNGPFRLTGKRLHLQCGECEFESRGVHHYIVGIYVGSTL